MTVQASLALVADTALDMGIHAGTEFFRGGYSALYGGIQVSWSFYRKSGHEGHTERLNLTFCRGSEREVPPPQGRSAQKCPPCATLPA